MTVRERCGCGAEVHVCYDTELYSETDEAKARLSAFLSGHRACLDIHRSKASGYTVRRQDNTIMEDP